MDTIEFERKRTGEIIANKIREKGSTQQKDADIIGISQGALSEIINGKRELRSDTLRRICKYYDISADYLLGISEVSSTDPDDKAICRKIGCSEDALNTLKMIYSSSKEDISPTEKQQYKMGSFVFELLLNYITKEKTK